MKKRIVSVVLSMAVLIAFMPAMTISASAQDTEPKTIYFSGKGTGSGAGTEENPYTTMDDALYYANPGDTIKLLSDVKIAEDVVDSYKNWIEIETNKDIILDLNGYVIYGKKPDNNNAIILNMGKLTITDSNSSKVHYFKVSESGLWEIQSGENMEADYTFDSTKGLKKNGKATKDIPAKDKIIAVKGGCITGAQTDFGGIHNTCELILQGGNIVGCEGSNNIYRGGAIYNNTDKEGYHPIVSMTGGAIIGNTALIGAIGAGDSFTMTGGIISYNAGHFCGGVYIGGEITIGGTARIEKNTGLHDNLGLQAAPVSEEPNADIKVAPIKIAAGADQPAKGMKVGISVIDFSGYVISGEQHYAKGIITEPGAPDCTKYLFSDCSDYIIQFNNNETDDNTTDDYIAVVDKPEDWVDPGDDEEEDDYECTYLISLVEGKDEQNLVLGEKEAGKYIISGNCCKGFSLKDTDGNYITCENGVLNTSSINSSFKWKYNGGLYTMNGCLKQYLAYDDTNDKFILSKCKAAANIRIFSEEHTFIYRQCIGNKHQAVCEKCGYKENAEEHTYNEDTHRCICGKLESDKSTLIECIFGKVIVSIAAIKWLNFFHQLSISAILPANLNWYKLFNHIKPWY